LTRLFEKADADKMQWTRKLVRIRNATASSLTGSGRREMEKNDGGNDTEIDTEIDTKTDGGAKKFSARGRGENLRRSLV